MNLNGLEVQMLSHYCFEAKCIACWGQTLYDSIVDGKKWRSCECSCHRVRRQS